MRREKYYKEIHWIYQMPVDPTAHMYSEDDRLTTPLYRIVSLLGVAVVLGTIAVVCYTWYAQHA